MGFASAETFILNEEADLKVTCLNDGYCSASAICNININNPVGIVITNNQNMTNQNSFHNYTFTPNETGQYSVTGFCEDGAYSKQIDFYFDVTVTGEAIGISQALINILLMLFFVGLGVGFHYIRKSVNFEQWYNRILQKYETKNFVKMILSALTFNIMKNSFIIYYLIGFPIMMIATSLSFSYNVNVLSGLMKVLMYIYGWGFALVGLAFLGYVQEWASDLIQRVEEMDWGIGQ